LLTSRPCAGNREPASEPNDRARCEYPHPRGPRPPRSPFARIVRGSGVRFFAPDVAFSDARRFLPELLRKRGVPVTDADAVLLWLEHVIEPVPSEIYDSLETVARRRLRGRDEDDWPILASALALGCPVWTEDTDFFGCGIAVWTTARVEIFLEAQETRRQADEE